MNRDYIRLTASAAQPERNEQGWEPGYNLIHLSVDGGPERRSLRVRAHVRVWQTAPGGFHAKMDKNSPVFEHSIALEDWHPIAIPTASSDVQPQTAGAVEMPTEEGDAMDTLRNLGLRFYKLSFSKKSEIAGRLELLEEEDMTLPDHERFRRVFIRAHDRGKLQQLSDAVTSAEQG